MPLRAQTGTARAYLTGTARAYLAGIGATGALIGAAIVVFLLAGSLVAFRGIPANFEESEPGTVSAPADRTPAPARDDARRPGRAGGDGGAGTGSASGTGRGGGGSETGGASPGGDASPVTPAEPGGAPAAAPATGSGPGAVSGPADGVSGSAGELGLPPGVSDVAKPITDPVEGAVPDTIPGGGAIPDKLPGG